MNETDKDFAEYGCGGTGEYSRCADMSDRFEQLVNNIDGAIMRLKMIRDDPTCPMNIAADIDQVLVQDLDVRDDE